MAWAYDLPAICLRRQPCVPATTASKLASRAGKRERGVFALNFAALLIVLLGFCALALELGLVYNRKVELHGVAKAVALAAARELNGTAAGVDAALARAETIARGFKYQYGISMPWSSAAITFGTSPSGSDWVDAGTARAAPDGRYYVNVNAGSLLDAGVGTVNTPFMSVLPDSFAAVSVSDRAVAGRSSVNVTPLAICAMSATPRAPRVNDGAVVPELVEYGFRRGVGYDLMKLSPDSATGKNFVVDPVFLPGGSGLSAHTSAARVASFVCAGNMWMPRVTGGQIRVSEGFPLSELYTQLNSRFDKFQNAPCSPNGSPPDFNVKPYDVADATSVGWMTPKPTLQAAALTTDAAHNPNAPNNVRPNKSETILDYPDPTPAGLHDHYGPLWSYSKAAKYSAVEPANGESFFTAQDWSHLYPGAPTNSSSSNPYLATSGTYYGRPALANVAISKESRRVLNVPLLSCPVVGTTGVPATVLAVGRFFMTVPATALTLHAEFAGIASEKTLTGPVELYP
jgi:Flp pilus assembly protein TadG